jgi:hypothetical protein
MINFTRNRYVFILLFFMGRNFLYAQYVELTIKDIKTGEVIPSVYVTAIKQNESFETISNLEGKVKLAIKWDSIITSHVAYESLHFNSKQLEKKILYLIPKTTELASITIFGTDLKEKIAYVLKNFSRFYINNERTYHCTYKETFKVDDSLVRLLQFNLRWWDRDYKTDLEKSYEYQNQVAIDAISYSRTKQGKAVYGSALSNKSLFTALHLNNYLTGLLRQAKNFTISAIEKTDVSTKISFDASIERVGEVIGNLKNSYFVFDNKTNALLELYTQLIYEDGQIQKVVSKKEKVPITIKHKRETRRMSFAVEKNKLRLSYFEFVGQHEDQVKDSTYSNENKLTIYIIGVEESNTILGASKIPLEEKPIYEQIQKTPKKDPSILLTHEELKFIEGNDND